MKQVDDILFFDLSAAGESVILPKSLSISFSSLRTGSQNGAPFDVFVFCLSASSVFLPSTCMFAV
jgi:hypothetical protein